MNHKENQRNENIKEINLNSKKTERTKIVPEDSKEEEERFAYHSKNYIRKIYYNKLAHKNRKKDRLKNSSNSQSYIKINFKVRQTVGEKKKE